MCRILSNSPFLPNELDGGAKFGHKAEFMEIRHMRRTNTRGFLALIGDLSGSRDVADRASLQRDLKQALRRISGRKPIAAVLAAGPEITAGDEFQILLHAQTEGGTGTEAMSFLVELSEDLPVRCAFGIGFGTLSTALKAPIRELDGTCFHRAREALERAKREDRWAVVAGATASDAEIANAISRLRGSLRETWTDRRQEIIRARGNTP